MLIDKQREGRSDHISLSPEIDQAQDPQMGGKGRGCWRLGCSTA